MTKVEYELMTVDEILEAKLRASVVFAPVSPIEWHGLHLPVGTDGLHAHHVAVQVARELGGVVLPTLFIGTDSVGRREDLEALGVVTDDRVVGMDFPGFPVRSLYFEESAFGIAVRELVRALSRDSFRLIVLVNGHGASNHMATLERIAREETRAGEVDVMSLAVWVPTSPGQDPGHAAREETAVMLSIAEEHVRLDRLPPTETPLRYAEYGIVDGPAFDGFPTTDSTVPPASDPRSATRREGEQILDEEVRVAIARVSEKLEPRPELATSMR